MPIWSLIWIGANVALVVAAAVLDRLEPPWIVRALHRWHHGQPQPMPALSQLAGDPIVTCRCGHALKWSWRGPEIADLRASDPDDGWTWHLSETAGAPRCPSLEHEARRHALPPPPARAREVR